MKSLFLFTVILFAGSLIGPSSASNCTQLYTWALSTSNSLMFYDLTSNQWTVPASQPSTFNQISAASRYRVWALDTSGRVHYYDSRTGWNSTSTNVLAQTISAGSETRVWAVSTLNGLNYYDTTSGWVSAGGFNNILSISATNENRVWVTTTNHDLAYYDVTTGWFYATTGHDIQVLSACKDAPNSVYLINTNHELYQFQEPNYFWYTGINDVTAISARNLFRIWFTHSAGDAWLAGEVGYHYWSVMKTGQFTPAFSTDGFTGAWMVVNNQLVRWDWEPFTTAFPPQYVRAVSAN